ncbi:MAG: anti-sigma factor [Candidatus Methylomirabilales bacterium]|nr:zf-HC2 domain-containing protein [candidate division NC10 bacterium]
MISCKEITNLLADYLEEALDEQTVQALEAHLSGCRICDNFMRTYQTTTTLLRDLGEEEIPGELKDRLLRFVRERKMKNP